MTPFLCVLCLDLFLVDMLKRPRSKERLLLAQETSSMERLLREAKGMLALVVLLSARCFEASWQRGNVQDKLCGHFSVCQLHR